MCGFRRNRSCSFFVGIAVFRQERQAALYNRRLGCVGIFADLYDFGNSLCRGSRGNYFGGRVQ